MEMNVDSIDEETTQTIERMAVLRPSTKHISLWTRHLEMKRNEICVLAGLMNLVGIGKEVRTEVNLETSVTKCTNIFPMKVKRMLYEAIDNMVWNVCDDEISSWIKRNKVYDKIVEDENV